MSRRRPCDVNGAHREPHFDARGALIAPRYGDLYFQPGPAGLAESRHVFLDGNDLPARARRAGDDPLLVAETGFGTGLNFLAAWQMWRRCAPRGARLTWVSIEARPLPAALAARALQPFTELRPLVDALLRHWPEAPAPASLHWLPVDAGGTVRLAVLFDDVDRALGAQHFVADAWCLDGFAPARNPAMWTPRVLRRVAERTTPGGTLATFSVAGSVRRALAAAGFAVVRRPGFGAKRAMLTGRLVTPPPDPRPADARWPAPARPRRVVIAGAGLAGCGAARALAERGCAVEVRDPHGRAAGASGQRALVLQPRLGAADQPDARLVARAFAWSRARLAQLDPARRLWRDCGVLHPARDAGELAAHSSRLARAADLDPEHARCVDAATADRLAGLPLGAAGGLWLPTAGLLRPRALCAALLDHPQISLRRVPTAGLEDAAGVRILADGMHCATRRGLAGLGLRATRGQATVLAATPHAAPDVVLCREGYLTPAIGARRSAGASYGRDDTARAPRAADDAANRARLAAVWPRLAACTGAAHRASEVGIRAVTADHLPRVGAVPEVSDAQPLPPRDARRAPAWRDGLYVSVGHGSRGAVTAWLAGELLAALLFGEPLPIPDALACRLAPSRALRRADGSG